MYMKLDKREVQQAIIDYIIKHNIAKIEDKLEVNFETNTYGIPTFNNAIIYINHKI